MGSINIRQRDRTNASPREGERQAWTEWQVVDGRRVVSRHDTVQQANDAAWAYREKRDAELRRQTTGNASMLG